MHLKSVANKKTIIVMPGFVYFILKLVNYLSLIKTFQNKF